MHAPLAQRTTLTPERWQRMRELFERVLPLEAEARLRFLLEECGDDVVMREQVVSLLLVSGDDGGEFEQRYDAAVRAALTQSEAPPGTLIGRYRVQRLLGRGGMGAVYLAERADDQYQQTVALKVVPRSVLHPGAMGRFRSERQILARLNHPNIARLLDGGHTEDGTPYFVMEYVKGSRIDLYCDQHDLSISARLQLVQQVCAAVQYAHQNLVVHRDLKPSNILVTGEGVPKLLDFGIAKLLDPEAPATTSELTRARDRVLTPEHASPEQLRGEPVGTVSDVYSLGVLLFQLLTGLPPYARPDRTMSELERAICEEDPPVPSATVRSEARARDSNRLRSLSRELGGDLDNIVLKAMQREPYRRYPSAMALVQDIQKYLDGRPVEARPNAWTYRTGKFLRRHRVAVASAGGVAILVTALIAFYTVRLAAERNTAEREKQTAASVADFMVEAFRLANPSVNQGNTITVRQVLDAAAARIEHDLSNQPRLRLTLMRNMGEAYFGLGLWTEAKSLLERAIAQERVAFGPRHLELARTLTALGVVADNLHQFDAAGRAYEEAWSIRTALKLDHDAEAVLLLNEIGSHLRDQQRFAEALEYHRRAEQAARALSPPDPQTLGQVLLGYGMTYADSRDYRNAEIYARESLPLVRDVVYQGNDLYADALATLGSAVQKQFRLAEAERLLRDFLERQIRRLGPDSLLVGRAWNNLANALRANGDYRECENALNEALRIYRLQSGAGDLDVAVSYHNLGSLHLEAGDLPRALQELDTALAFKRKSLGERSPQMASTLLVKAAVLREMGRLAEARTVFDDAQAIAVEKFGRDDRRHVLILTERGRLELASGQVAAAEQDLRTAVTSLQGQDDPGRLADTMASLGEALVRDGRFADARSVLSDTLALRRKILPPGHWALADAQSRLGETLILTGEAAQGRALLTQALIDLRARRPAGDPAVLAAEKRVADSTRVR